MSRELQSIPRREKSHEADWHAWSVRSTPPVIPLLFGPDDDGCDHGDYSDTSDADSPDTDDG